MTTPDKVLQLLIAIGLFIGVMAVVLLIADRFKGKRAEGFQVTVFLIPAVLMIAFGLLYPALRTVFDSFRDANSVSFVGVDNYKTVFTDKEQLTVLRNTVIWVLVTPVAATFIGLLYALFVDKARWEKLAKALLFLPMALSLVGASLIWKFVYDYKASENDQIGILNQILKSLGFDTYRFLLNEPWNTLFLIIIMIWVQAGFAMTVLSAAIRAIPNDIIDAAKLDGATAFSMFRYVTVPAIRPALIVVLTTISIATLKVFDIVRTATGGNFKTSVVAYEFYVQSFRSFNFGLGAALATLLFVLCAPIVIYNVRQMRRLEA